MRVYWFRSQGFYGFRLGGMYVVLKDMRRNRAYYSERNGLRGHHCDFGAWRLRVTR